MRNFILGLLVVPAASFADLDARVQTFVEHSLPRLACNLSPGAPGSIVASPASWPDYRFHWVRDSALIVETLVRLIPYANPDTQRRLHGFIGDFAEFSLRLQNSGSPHGQGEVRYNLDGTVDTIKWSRPQWDGPALRARALLAYLESYGSNLTSDRLATMRAVIRVDLDAVAAHFNEPGFDLWEYSKGFHFYTRMVQIAALRRGLTYFGPMTAWMAAARTLETQLDRHWHEGEGYLSFSESEGTDVDGNPVPQPGGGLDTSAALAANHAQWSGQRYGTLSGPLWSTLWKLESYFARAFPVNAGLADGPAIGRHQGDGYFGGNAFFFLTSAYAEHYFRLARLSGAAGGSVTADEWRRPVLEHVLKHEVAAGTLFAFPHAELSAAMRRNGEAFLEHMLAVIPADGALAEQYGKTDGAPASAYDLSWSYSSVLSAILERESGGRTTVDYGRLDFRCPSALF